MTNRQKLIKTYIFDLLCELNKAITCFSCDCVMEALTCGKIHNNLLCDEFCNDACGQCISNWLDEEAME